MLAFVIALILIAFFCALLWFFFDRKYQFFVMAHSKTVHRILTLNEEYHFKTVPKLDMEHSYDNEHFYNDVSPTDYLIYQLVTQKRKYIEAMNLADENKELYTAYYAKIEKTCCYGEYNTEVTLSSKAKLLAVEKRLVRHILHKPNINFSVVVTLCQTNIRGVTLRKKKRVFDAERIWQYIREISQKNGDRYLNRDVWDAICRVERGKVSNKMRFAIYARDHYRCRKCGRAAKRLEIDHIFPIAKGGKSNFENLQTLCHFCNALKADTVEEGVRSSSQYKVKEFCPECGAGLVVKKGKNGGFYACPNYPKCKYSKTMR